MRLLIIVLTVALLVAVLGFVLTNLGTRVPLTVFDRTYDDVALYVIAIVSVFVGICYAGIIAVAEGAHIRIVNRRMTREIRRMETEMHYLRTQSKPSEGREPDSLAPAPESPGAASRRSSPDGRPPDAPVYGADDDSDDDPYTGGRAV